MRYYDNDAVCPFFKKDAGLKVYCEMATLRFPDVESKEQFVAACCDMRGCKECPLYKTLNAYYERKYKEG